MNVGFLHSDSKKCQTSLSINLATVLGCAQTTLCFTHWPSKNDLASSVLSLSFGGNSTCNLSAKVDIMGILLKGVVKSISMKLALSSGPLGW